MTADNPLATLNPSVIGRTEKAHNAVLDRVLSGTSLDEQRWITLQLALASAPVRRTDLVARVTAAAKFDPDAVHQAVTGLAGAGLVRLEGDAVAVTDAGVARVSALRQQIGDIIGPAYAAVPAEDRAVAARVLARITERLDSVLAAD